MAMICLQLYVLLSIRTHTRFMRAKKKRTRTNLPTIFVAVAFFFLNEEDETSLSAAVFVCRDVCERRTWSKG